MAASAPCTYPRPSARRTRHFDHIGGNQRFPDTPVLVQRTEFATARAGGYTMDSLPARRRPHRPRPVRP
uniref:hypothetical protein n=1 Tax=Streptomyces sp. MSC1_001 TaxID=2909263 RepID=UPI0027E4B436|nr:hypothetical protein [Streptomyces sp. MSC1_001]